MTAGDARLGPRASRLGDFIRDSQEQIIAAWMQRMRELWPRRHMSDATLVDHLPQILNLIVEIMQAGEPREAVSFAELPHTHALARLGRGFELDQVVNEYAVLRRSIFRLWQSRVGPAMDVGDLEAFDAALDQFVEEAVVRYSQARDGLLKALDGVLETALSSSSSDLDTLLDRLIRATLETTEAADTGVVMLRTGDALQVRAAVGLEDDLRSGLSVNIGEGFAGHVAAEGKPLAWHEAAGDPRVKSSAMRKAGVRGLYGVPLLRDGEVIGVAHIGSLRASEFSEEDKLLFRTMVSRATEAIFQHMLRQEAQAHARDRARAEEEQRLLKDASATLASSLDYHETLSRLAKLAVPVLADWCVVDVLEDGQIRRVSIAHTDPEKVRWAYALAERYPPEPNAPTGVPNVVRTGRPEWHAEITDAHLAAMARDAEHLSMLRRVGLTSYILVPIRLRDRVFGVLGLVSAESQRRYAEADVRIAEELASRAATAIENALLYAEAQEAVQIRDQILAVVSHDLRNQLGVVSMAAKLLDAKIPASTGETDLRKPVGMIQRTTEDMQRLLGDLLDMASIQAGRLSVARRLENIQQILLESCERHEPLAQAKDLMLRSDVERLENVQVSCDRNRILQALSNLLGNAIKFCRAGDSIVVRGETRDRTVLVCVSDTGPGIPPEQLETIFQPYRTIRRRGESGTGLGLHIAKGIIRSHEGRIWAESQVGVGTTMFCTLPRA